MVSQNLTDVDVIALVSDEIFQPKVFWKLGDLQVNQDFICDFVAS